MQVRPPWTCCSLLRTTIPLPHPRYYSDRPKASPTLTSSSSSSTSPSTSPGTSESTLPPPPRPRHTQLSTLPPSQTSLTFASLSYSSPPNLLFPPSHTPRQSYTPPSRAWSLRCFPAQPRLVARHSPTSSPRSNDESSVPKPKGKAMHLSPPLLRLLPSLSSKLPKDHPLYHHLVVPRKNLLDPYELQLTIMASKKGVHNSAVVRNRCRRRFKEAVRLVVTREAQGGKGGEGQVVEVDEGGVKGPRRWLIPGYTYIVNLTLEVYKQPLSTMVNEIRQGLLQVKSKTNETAYRNLIDSIEVPEEEEAADSQ